VGLWKRPIRFSLTRDSGISRRRPDDQRGDDDQRERAYFPFSSDFCSWFPAWPMMSLGLIGTTLPESSTRV